MENILQLLLILNSSVSDLYVRSFKTCKNLSVTRCKREISVHVGLINIWYKLVDFERMRTFEISSYNRNMNNFI